MLKKLYEKNEIWFAVAWILIYVLVTGNLRDNFGDESPMTLLGLAVILMLLLVFVYRNHLSEKYGLSAVHGGRKYLFFLPMLIPCTINLWCGVSMHYELKAQIIAVINMAIVGFVEELIFRGLLFRAIEKSNVKRAIVISAVTFGVGHIVNLVSGQAGVETTLQMLYAIALGFAFVMMFYKTRSIWPAAICHAAIDITWKFSNQNLSVQAEAMFDYFGSTLVIVVAALYAVYLYTIKGNGDE